MMAQHSRPRRRPKGKERVGAQPAEGYEAEDAMMAREKGMHMMPDGEMMSYEEMKKMKRKMKRGMK